MSKNSNLSSDKIEDCDNSSWQVSTDDKIGRILTATRDINPWEIVITDKALILGPKVSAVCLGCLKPVNGEFKCKKCQWPMCSEKCSSESYHKLECEIFTSRRLSPTINDLKRNGMYPCVTILRMLLLKKYNEDGWRQIKNMMDHWELRCNDKKVAAGISVMTKLFTERLGLDWVRIEDVQHCYGVLKTNSVDIGDEAGQALFPQSICIMSHSCHANLEPAKHPQNTIIMRAKRKIKKGEELTIFYTDFMESRHSIRTKLHNEWKFWCQCQRCNDKSEFGSNFSSFKCDCGGYFYNGTEGYSTSWKCSKCKIEKDLTDHYKVADEYCEILPTQSSSIDLKLVDDVIAKHQYHKQFYVAIKLYILFINSNQHSKDRKTMEDVLDRTDIVLNTMSQLEGGCSRLAGKYLQIRSACHTSLLQMKHANQEISEEELKSGISQVLKCKLLVSKLRG